MCVGVGGAFDRLKVRGLIRANLLCCQHGARNELETVIFNQSGRNCIASGERGKKRL